MVHLRLLVLLNLWIQAMSETHDCPMSQSHQLLQRRRALLVGAGVTCTVVLAGCTTYDANNGGFAGPPPATSGAASSGGDTAPPASGGGAATGGAPAANALTSTSDVPDGGGKIIDGKNIVITQPQAGSFKAFTAVCTHQGCIVSSVSGGTINCPCHGSKFSIKDGSVVNGPATSPLAPIAIKVEGTSIVQG
jgi:nitrite reductase/ring-hydroxylating ferredoxin subunit